MTMDKNVAKTLIATWLVLLLAMGLTMAPVWMTLAQEEAPAATEAESEQSDETAGDADAEDEVEIDDSDLDEQTYEEDEYDFTPSQEIPADQPIPFPTNI